MSSICRKSFRQIKFEEKWSQKATPLNQIFVFVYNDANICSQEWSAVLLSSEPSPSPDLRQPLFTCTQHRLLKATVRSQTLSCIFWLKLIASSAITHYNACEDEDKLTNTQSATQCIVIVLWTGWRLANYAVNSTENRQRWSA